MIRYYSKEEISSFGFVFQKQKVNEITNVLSLRYFNSCSQLGFLHF